MNELYGLTVARILRAVALCERLRLDCSDDTLIVALSEHFEFVESWPDSVGYSRKHCWPIHWFPPAAFSTQAWHEKQVVTTAELASAVRS
jgi:hypothetical protein